MEAPNNVHAGPDGLKKYFDPDVRPPLPLVELPAQLNPYRGDGMRIYAKMMTCPPAHNVKALPAMNLLEGSVTAGVTRRVVEYSSGSTAISMSMLARVRHGIDDVHAYMSNKTSPAKLSLMRFFGLRLTLFGGPAQPEPTDGRATANPNQYENKANWRAHYRWTGPQLLRQLPRLGVFCAGMGTSGTMTGVGSYLRHHKPDVWYVAACTVPGERPSTTSSRSAAGPRSPPRAAVSVSATTTTTTVDKSSTCGAYSPPPEAPADRMRTSAVAGVRELGSFQTLISSAV